MSAISNVLLEIILLNSYANGTFLHLGICSMLLRVTSEMEFQYVSCRFLSVSGLIQILAQLCAKWKILIYEL